MKLRNVFASLALCAMTAFASTSARAQGVDPCSTYMCMAGISGFGATGGPICSASYTTFFLMQVWDPWFDPEATSTLRRGYLMSCPGANGPTNEGILSEIIAIWGMVP